MNYDVSRINIVTRKARHRVRTHHAINSREIFVSRSRILDNTRGGLKIHVYTALCDTDMCDIVTDTPTCVCMCMYICIVGPRRILPSRCTINPACHEDANIGTVEKDTFANCRMKNENQ